MEWWVGASVGGASAGGLDDVADAAHRLDHRFAAGVASNAEVVQAQESVPLANEQFIAAQYGYALAKGALIRCIRTPAPALRQHPSATRSRGPPPSPGALSFPTPAPARVTASPLRSARPH